MKAPKQWSKFMARPVWQGHLRLSLVTCPVAVFNATTSARDVSFHLLHKKTHHRIRMVPHDPSLGAVERQELVKGYEFEPGKYVVLTPAEIAAVRLPTTKTIDIEEFVEQDDIDRLYWNDPYYLTPQEEAETPAYTVIRDAMAESGRLAIGRIVMHNRERVVAIEARGKGLLMTTLRSFDEVRSDKDFFRDIPDHKPDRKMLDIAQQIIDQLSSKFEPKDFNDRYEDALRDVIKRKQKGQPVVTEKAPEDTKVIDLMDALKRSLGGKGAKAEGKAHARRVLTKQSGHRTKGANGHAKVRPKKRASARR
jgi:DNA end-binding protein Ku